jgi:hypothetical protein
MDPVFQLWFTVRYVHVASVALLAGGAMIIAAGCFAPREDAGSLPGKGWPDRWRSWPARRWARHRPRAR